ncbi:ATP-grasp fold amidoligase family protein [Nesterenkonia sp.]|uniref:ATP-grasp fold amidoligase family protein n=1 Tax=Nesterenkonia sp. TaxID=704201 RepID=UPI002617BCB6|nr:ATP-grasp fold amidoligase family protein [Nesterenkonia sp.]
MTEDQDLSPQEVIELMHTADDAMRRTLGKMLAPRAMRQGGDEHIDELRKLLAVASPHHVRDIVLHRMRPKKLFVGRGLSFMGAIVAKTEAARLTSKGSLPGWILSNKQSAYEFMDILDIRRPRTPDSAKPMSEIELTPGTVIKPTAGSGSKGVYLVFDSDDIFHAKDGRQFSDKSSLERHAQAILKDRSSATSAKRDSWSTEELVLFDRKNRRPAVDLKFWSFYGKIAFITEISRHPETRWDFWSPTGERIEAPGRWKATRYHGVGFEPEHLELVKRISSEIPYPFMRIDMLRGEDELVFGEFTPRPGSSNVFTPEWDRKMGEMWALAEIRLQQDLLKGKDFAAYKVFQERRRRREKAERAAKRRKKK